MNILSPNEKVVFLRKKFKISQNELTMGKFSRSYLGMVEIGKTNFNNSFAENIIENFNTIFEKKDIDYRVTIDYLMESKQEQIKKIAANFLKRIEDDNEFENVATEIENFISEYDLDIKIGLYKKLADKLFDNFKYKRSLYYYLRIFNDVLVSKNLKLLSKVSLNIIRISNDLEKTDEILRIEKIINQFLDKFDETEEMKISYNLGLTFIKIKNYKTALEYFNNYIKINKNIKEGNNLSLKEFRIFHGNIMKATALVGLKDYEHAINLLRSLLKTYHNPLKKVKTNVHLMLTYLELNEIEKIKYYFRKNRKLVEQNKNEILCDDLLKYYYDFGRTASFLNRNELAIKYYEMALDIKLEYLVPNIDIRYELVLDYRLNAIEKLLNLYTKKDVNKVDQLFKKYIEINKLSFDLNGGYNFICYYNKYNFKTKINESIKSLRLILENYSGQNF